MVNTLQRSPKIDDILAETRLAMQKKMFQKVTTTGVDLDSVYSQTLQQIKEQKRDRRRLGMKVLMWLSHAKRPLRIDELCHALAVDVEATDLDPKNIRPQDTVLGSCLGLAFVDKKTSTVRPIHDTLQKYLSRPGILPGAHQMLGETCLAYLNYDQIKRLPVNEAGDLGQIPFLEYSSFYWVAHAKIELSDRAENLALELLNQYENHISFKKFWSSDYPKPRSPLTCLHFASEVGIDALVAALIETKSYDINREDSRGCTPLMHAVKNKNYGVVKLLLTCDGVDPDKPENSLFGKTPLQWAIKHKDVEIVRLLVQGGANPYKEDNDGQTPFMLASSTLWGNRQMVALFQPQPITISDLD